MTATHEYQKLISFGTDNLISGNIYKAIFQKSIWNKMYTVGEFKEKTYLLSIYALQLLSIVG